MHFCPHTDCDYRGWLGLNNLRANGHPSGGPWRQFHCTSCNGYFPEHHGTIFHGKQAAVELIVRVLACLAEGLGIRATARVFEVDPNTVLQWLVEAAEQLRAFPPISSVISTWSSCNSMSCTPCCERSKPARSATTRRSRRAGRCWGLCRYRDLLDLKVHVRIPAFEDGAQFPVERPHARL